MAESSSPAFNPPMNRITENDPQIEKVSMTSTEMGFRSSQTPKSGLNSPGNTVRHIQNGN